MSRKWIIPAVMATLLGLGAASGAAKAETTDGNQNGRDTAALAETKISLAQAITTAEQNAGGRAVSADIADTKAGPRIDVEVANAQGVKMVAVDGKTGQVTAAPAGDDTEDAD